MSVAIIATSSNDLSLVSAPVNGDNLSAAPVQQALQFLCNSIKYGQEQTPGDFAVMGGLDVTDAANVGSLFSNAGIAAVGDVSCADLSANNVNVAAVGTNDLEVFNDTLLDGAVSIGGNLTCNSALLTYGAVAINGIMTFGAGARALRRAVTGANANTTYSPADQNFVIVRATDTYTAARDYTVSNTGQNGDWIRISCNNASFQCNVHFGAFVVSIGGGLTFQWIEIEVLGGVLTCVGAGTLPVGV